MTGQSKTPKWKKLEEDVAELFRQRMELEPLVYHRFYDTHSAGSLLPEQPADHLVIWRGLPILIETKYSSRFASLASCFGEMVKDGQIASARIWGRAGAYSLFLFQGTEHYELWNGDYLALCRVNGDRLHKDCALKRDELTKEGLARILSNVIIGCPSTTRKTFLL